MNRRMFLKLSSTGAAIGIVMPVALFTTGCGFSAVGTINLVISAIQSILSYVGTSTPWASELEAALTALQQAEASWQSGSPIAIVIDALNTIEAITAVIPFTAIYSPLIDLIVSGIEAIINYFTPTTLVNYTKPRVTRSRNPRVGRVAIKAPGVLQTPLTSFKQQYNDAAIGCGCPQLEVK